ncbi:hypothetical protein AALB_0118 [Agarivorans albus MKT 106]|uniref:Uncharacterized protein n=1 Tax=Agarivorans albus MKT 106 TaxID=1331007 RepID=R9PFK7_AGAAL|nr:hypothetical protein AALB_0118 [Agarivorans albus MKT 106]
MIFVLHEMYRLHIKLLRVGLEKFVSKKAAIKRTTMARI